MLLLLSSQEQESQSEMFSDRLRSEKLKVGYWFSGAPEILRFFSASCRYCVWAQASLAVVEKSALALAWSH
jgi:hypothetical protein